MQRKISSTVIIFISVFMLNVSAMAFQQRYDRREEDQESDPFVIEMTDVHIFKFLKNTYFFEIPDKCRITEVNHFFFNNDAGFGNQMEIVVQYFGTCQLKFVLANHIGFYRQKEPKTTYFWEC